MRHSLTWFIDRIGKRIYRHTKKACCKHCDSVYRKGLIVGGKMHANYLYDCQNEMSLIYSDKKKGM